MSVRTRAHPTSLLKKRNLSVIEKKENGTPWREVAKENLKKYTESGLAVRGARFKAGITQKELADAVGAKPHHISEMEHGKRSIGKEMARKLAAVLNVSYKVFL